MSRPVRPKPALVSWYAVCFSGAVSTPTTPARDRIAAITVVILLHALLILHAVMLRDAGGRPGQGLRDAVGEGREVLVEVNFVKRNAAPKLRPVAIEVPLPPVKVEHSPVGEPVPAEAGAVADEKTRDIASIEDAHEGGGNGAPKDDLGTRYLAAVRAAVLAEWTAQGGGAIPAGCKIMFDQATGGHALRAWVMQCASLPLRERIRLESAVMQVEPLPYAGFEPVFQEHMELEF